MTLPRRAIPPELLQGPRALRVVASGTLFVTHTLSLPTHPEPSTTVRAHSVSHSRGGGASTVLSMLAQFAGVDAMLIAPLSGNDEGQVVLRELRGERVSTRHSKIWEELGVPSAWVLNADDEETRTVINHNPLPDITHEDFISLLGPLLAPENYTSAPPPRTGLPPFLQSPAPFDWLHFEGRSVKTTLSNMHGIDGLARERRWRGHCVFSLDVGRKTRQGVEALIPHADVIFLNQHYAQAHSPHYAASPRAFLLSLAGVAPAHALLVAHWGQEGSALLSVPTREYFQSSSWVQPPAPASPVGAGAGVRDSMLSTETAANPRSVRSGSDFYAGHHTPSGSSAFTRNRMSGMTDESQEGYGQEDDEDAASETTEVAGKERAWAGLELDEGVIDEVGAQEAFIAGMIYALSRRLMPGPQSPWSPVQTPSADEVADVDKGRWRLEECLKFATEMAGRKARMRGWTGLAEQMKMAGWLDAN